LVRLAWGIDRQRKRSMVPIREVLLLLRMLLLDLAAGPASLPS
jgi:hypothetical protein